MARLAAAATGVFSSSGTWVVIDAATALVTEGGTAQTNLTTSSGNSANITPTSNITIDAIAIRIGSVGGATGTLTMTLYNVTTTASVVAVNVPIADLPTASNATGSRAGWFLISTGDQNLTSGSNYQVRLNVSVGSSTIGVQTNGTAANWQHLFRTKTAQAPAAGDDLFVMGLWTSSGTWTQYAVTMDWTTGSTVFGSNPGAGVERSGIFVCKSSVSWQNSGSTNYALSVAGNVTISWGGTWEMGTSGAPCTASSTMTLQFNTTTGYGLIAHIGGTISTFGLARTSGKNVSWTILTSDATSGSTTTYAVQDDTCWLTGDTVYISSTDPSDGAKAAELTLSGDAGTNSIPATTASANYEGTWPIPAVLALTKMNVIIQSDNSGRAALCIVYGAGAWNAQWLLFNYGGVTFNATTSNMAWRYVCSNNKAATLTTWNFAVTGTVGGTVSLKDMVWIGNASIAGFSINMGAGSDVTNWTINDLIVICDGTSASLLYCPGPFASLKGLKCMGGDGYLNPGTRIAGQLPSDFLQDSWQIGNGGLGNRIDFGFDMYGVTITGFRAYVSGGGSGIGAAAGEWYDVTFLNCIFMAVDNPLFSLANDFSHTNVVFDNCVFGYPGAGTWNLYGTFGNFNLGHLDHTYYSCDLEATTATGVGPAYLMVLAGDGGVGSAPDIRLSFLHCKTAAALVYGDPDGVYSPSSFVSSVNHNRSNTDHRITWLSKGIGTGSAVNLTQTDATVYNTAAPSEKMTPMSASVKLPSSVKRVAVSSGSTAAITVYVRKSATYNGAEPRLMMKRNDAVGVTALTVGDTMTAAVENWEQLSYTTPTPTGNGVLEFYVDCDGTVGYINVDDWSAT